MLALALSVVFFGCQPTGPSASQSPAGNGGGQAGPAAGEAATASEPSADREGEHGHSHANGAHGGTIVPLGRDSYHIEPVFESEGRVSLYTLGADETRLMEIEARPVTGYVRLSSGGEAVAMEFSAAPQQGDGKDKTSRLSATLPETHRGGPVEITIPAIMIEGERFRFAFSTPAPVESSHAMPIGVAGDEQRKLYLEPGGAYTEADIEANGRTTAAAKFAGKMWPHDTHPKTGDPLCPITNTLANAECSWVIGGKKYEFCCPPCVDQFVILAKSDPDKILPPESYIQK